MEPVPPLNVERACPICGGRSYEHFSDERIDQSKISDFTYSSRKQPEFMCLKMVRCTDCDLVYAPMPPAGDFLSTAYSSSAYDSGPEAQAAAQSYMKVLTPHIERIVGRNAAVDVGAGNGSLLPWLKKSGFDPVIGIEPSRAAIDTASPSVRSLLREGMFSPALLSDENPSLMCSFMTLEHLSDPAEFVNQVYELLEPGGMIAVVVHNWRAPLNRLLGLRSPIIDVEHLQLFSQQSLQNLMTRTGFTSISLQSISNAYPIRYWLRLSPAPDWIKRRLNNALKFFGISDSLLSLRVGNILAIGFKPPVKI